jgi:hypothetical protein
MRWAALYRRPPILRGVSASQIRADHAANQGRVKRNIVVDGIGSEILSEALKALALEGTESF